MKKKQALPEYLRQLRKFYCCTQKDIASQLNISRQTYSHYETGRIMPSINILYRLAQIYGISVDDILKQTEVEKHDLWGGVIYSFRILIKQITFCYKKSFWLVFRV